MATATNNNKNIKNYKTHVDTYNELREYQFEIEFENETFELTTQHNTDK